MDPYGLGKPPTVGTGLFVGRYRQGCIGTLATRKPRVLDTSPNGGEMLREMGPRKFQKNKGWWPDAL